jgi:hypothetical protein
LGLFDGKYGKGYSIFGKSPESSLRMPSSLFN